MKENILDLLQLKPITLFEISRSNDIEKELEIDTLIYKFTFLSVSFYCLSTEKRFEEEKSFLLNPNLTSEISDS